MKIGDLTPDQLISGSPGLVCASGWPLRHPVRTPIARFVSDFSVVYRDFPVCDESEVSDFRIRVTPALRRWPWREAQAEFRAEAQPVPDLPPTARHAVMRNGASIGAFTAMLINS